MWNVLSVFVFFIHLTFNTATVINSNSVPFFTQQAVIILKIPHRSRYLPGRSDAMISSVIFIDFFFRCEMIFEFQIQKHYESVLLSICGIAKPSAKCRLQRGKNRLFFCF